METTKLERMRSGEGFIAALDQSGGSTPKALKLYGLDKTSYHNENEMFELVHQMRSRIINSPVFQSKRILAVILFEKTMQSQIAGRGSAEYLWNEKAILSFLKIDNGLDVEALGVQLMKPIPELQSRLSEATSHGVFGTKMRSLIKLANSDGIGKILDQQFEVAKVVIEHGLIPIIEPEVDIKSPEKERAEEILAMGLQKRLDALPEGSSVILKLTLPSEANKYFNLTHHPRVLRVAALSGGYSRKEACGLLQKNNGLIASFSRALTEGLSAQQSESEFDGALDASIESIFEASIKK
jgi:fructose-bisphosphate aldolase class I